MLPIALANVFITAVGIYLNDLRLISVLTILFMVLVVYMSRNAIGKAGGKRYAD
jgi:hypothetical protein